jgi:hypothetical protein
VGGAALLMRASEQLGISADAALAAESSGLIEFGAQVRFRHPLVRAAAYRAASLPDRRRVHRVLAEVTDPDADPGRRAWHRAYAAVGPEESVADELERSASQAQARGGVAAAAAFLERATELTPDPARRAARALAAAQAKFEAAAPDTADELLSVAELGSLNDLQRAQAARLRAQIVFRRSRGSDAAALFLEAARAFEGLDDGSARETYLEAFGAAMFAGQLGPPSLAPAWPVSTMTWVTSTGPWPNSSRLVSEAARSRRPRPPSGNSRNEPGPAARTGLSASWPGRRRC